MTSNRPTGARMYARFATINVVRAIRLLIDDTLSRLDEWLCSAGYPDDDEQDDEPEPCICGSTEHSPVRVAYTATHGLLQNGEFGSLPVEVIFSFDETDSIAVQMRVTLAVDDDNGRCLGHDSQFWEFARDILDTAMSREDEKVVGEGDVAAQYIPSQSDVYLWLTDINGERHRLDVDASSVTEFLQASHYLVPLDAEPPPVDDDAIARLIDGTWEK